MTYTNLRKNLTIVIFAYCGGIRKNNAMVSAKIALLGDITQKIAQKALTILKPKKWPNKPKIRSKKPKVRPEKPKNCQTVQKPILISPYQKDMKILQLTASHQPVKEAQQRYLTYQKCYLIAAPLMFPPSLGPNRPPHTAREYPR